MICCSLHWVIKTLLTSGLFKIGFLPSHQLGELHLRGVHRAEGGREGQWLHSLTLAAALLERIPSVRARIAGASGSITCADDLSRQLIMPAMQHGSATVR